MKITETINSPHQSSRNGHTPELIILHICDGYYEATKGWFASPASQTSSHFIVAKDGRICQCVPLDKMAWCNGTGVGDKSPGLSTVELVQLLGGNANQYSVSIECEGFWSETQGSLTEAQLSAVAWLVNYIRDEVKQLYNHTIPLDRRYIVGHNEITPRTRPHCPGEKFPWSQLMAKLLATKTLYGVVGQKAALSIREAADSYATQLNAKGEGGWYWKVLPIEGTTLFGIMGQQIALSDRAQAEEYAAVCNTNEKAKPPADRWYWKVIEIQQ